MGIDELIELKAEYERELYIAEARVNVIVDLIKKVEQKFTTNSEEITTTEQSIY